jgi:hypothetical protein
MGSSIKLCLAVGTHVRHALNISQIFTQIYLFNVMICEQETPLMCVFNVTHYIPLFLLWPLLSKSRISLNCSSENNNNDGAGRSEEDQLIIFFSHLS